jgi:hypothetical protein
MTTPKWLDVVKSVKAKYPKGTSLKEVLPEASKIWSEIKNNNKLPVKDKIAKKTIKNKGKKGKRKTTKKIVSNIETIGKTALNDNLNMLAMAGGSSNGQINEIDRLEIAQNEPYGNVNSKENVVQPPGMPTKGVDNEPEHSLMQKGAQTQLNMEGDMLENFKGGKARKNKKPKRKTTKRKTTKRKTTKRKTTKRKSRKQRK